MLSKRQSRKQQRKARKKRKHSNKGTWFKHQQDAHKHQIF